jgi:D-arginine dehydrogenase
VPLVAYRRHLFTSAPARRPRGRPWVWDVAHGLYFRADGPGYLLSGCDEDAHEPGDPPVDPNRRADLAKRVLRWMPALGELELVRSWACLRTFAPDRRPVIGPDPEIRGLFYAAGLGGHGVTASFAIGRLAAAGVLAPKEVPALFHAERFARPRKA